MRTLVILNWILKTKELHEDDSWSVLFSLVHVIDALGVKQKVESVQPIRIIHILCVPIISPGIMFDVEKESELSSKYPIFITWCDSLKYQQIFIKGRTIKFTAAARYIHRRCCFSQADGVHGLRNWK